MYDLCINSCNNRCNLLQNEIKVDDWKKHIGAWLCCIILWHSYVTKYSSSFSTISFFQMLSKHFSTQGCVSPVNLWNVYTQGRLRKIAGKLIKSRLQPGNDGGCVTMTMSNKNIPSWYSLSCLTKHRWYICKRLAETVSQPLPNHVVTSDKYSKCKLREVYAVNGCYVLDKSPTFSPNSDIDIEDIAIKVNEYLVHLFQCLGAVTGLHYQLQMQTSATKMIGSNTHHCVLITPSNSLSYEETIYDIKEGKCIPTNTSITYSVFAGENPKSECENNQIPCDDGTCITHDYSCFDHIYYSPKRCACRNEAQLVYDKHYCRHLCMLQNCSCPSHYFQCGSGGCIPFTLICDGRTHCVDASDEMCGQLTRITSQDKDLKHKGHTEVICLMGRAYYCLGYQCLSGECIPLVNVNDLIPDCFGGEAEDERLLLRMFYHEEYFDCVERNHHPCVAGLPVCFTLDKLCVLDSDEEQNILWCRNGAHLSDCTYINCTNSYKCPQSYCIPLHRVCNGNPDCIHGEDEEMCDNYICKGLLRCKGSRICVHPAQICDGKSHCLQGDDEKFCDWKSCAVNCTCVGYSTICTGLVDETLPPMQSDYMKHMSVRRSYLPNPIFHNICYQKGLIYLNLSGNYIRDICSSLCRDCEIYKSIFLLDLSHNVIRTFKSSCVSKLTNLKIILLAYNSFQLIDGDAFFSLSVEYFDMKHIKIREIKAKTLHGISTGIVDFSDSVLHLIDGHAQNVLSYIPKLIFNDPRFCCLLPHTRICQNLLHVLDSCPNIFPHRLMGYIIILIGCFSVLTNAVGLILNAKFIKVSLHTETVSYLMIVNIVLGTYLPLIGSVAIYYDQRIVFYHVGWTQSSLCSFMEVLSSTSLMISLCLNGLSMFVIVGAVTRIKLNITKTQLAVRILLMSVFVLVFNMTQSLFKANNYGDTEAFGVLCNILGASKVLSVSQGVSDCVICAMMLSSLMYILFGAISVICYINETTKQVLKYSEGGISKHNARKRMICKRMIELSLVTSFITLPYPLLKTLSLRYEDIPKTFYTGVMFSTIIIEIFYTPLSYIYIPLLNRICNWHDWIAYKYATKKLMCTSPYGHVSTIFALVLYS